MKCRLVTFSLVLIFCSFIAQSSAAFDKVVGYFSSWSVYRVGDGKFDIDLIDAHLYTHLIFAFVGINDNGEILIVDNDIAPIQRFVNLKTQNNNLKVLVAIGGGDETSSQVFTRVSKDPSKRRALIDNAVHFIGHYGFDGFDLDWEYPGATGDPEDKGNFALWVQEFRQEFNKHGYLLTAAVSGAQWQIDISYDIPAINAAVDFINLMTYDVNGPWTRPTGYNAPMSGVSRYLDNWISAGMDPQKIAMGVPAYGNSYTLENAGNNGVGAHSTGPGEPGPYANARGVLLYNEVVEYLTTGTWTLKYDDGEQVPYMHKGDQWVSYDDEASVAIKVQYAKSRNLAGIMVWSIDMDDFVGKTDEVNKLQKTIRRNMDL